jgi:hypothetical protein
MEMNNSRKLLEIRHNLINLEKEEFNTLFFLLPHEYSLSNMELPILFSGRSLHASI